GLCRDLEGRVPGWSPARPFAEGPEQQVFRERHALEFHELDVLLHASIERHADLPGSCKHLRVLDRGFVQQMVRTDGRIAFDHMKSVTMKVPRPIEPGLRPEP